MRTIQPEKLKYYSWLIAGLILLVFIINAGIHYNYLLWDFQLYYYAGKAMNDGVNPYDRIALSSYYKLAQYFPVSYTYFGIMFYRVFAFFDYSIAVFLFQFSKTAALIIIVYIWLQLFVELRKSILFPFVIINALNMAIVFDIRSGNIALIETMLITLSFLFFNKKQYCKFAVIIIIASLFKILPVLFLCMLLFTGERKNVLLFFSSCIAFALLLFLPCLVSKELFFGFFRNASLIIDERGIYCPSTLPLIRDFFKIVSDGTLPDRTAVMVFALAVIILSANWIIKAIRIRDNLSLILISVLTFALIHPRFKDYSYTLLIGPVYYLISNIKNKYYRIIAVIALILPTRGNNYTEAVSFYHLFTEYYPWYILIAAFLLFEYKYDRKKID